MAKSDRVWLEENRAQVVSDALALFEAVRIGAGRERLELDGSTSCSRNAAVAAVPAQT